MTIHVHIHVHVPHHSQEVLLLLYYISITANNFKERQDRTRKQRTKQEYTNSTRYVCNTSLHQQDVICDIALLFYVG